MFSFLQFKSYLCLGSCLFILSCTTYNNYVGKLPDFDQISKIKVGIETKEGVLKLIGSPSSVIAFNRNIWIYDYSIQTYKSFFKPVEIKHQLYILTFDSKNIVQNIVKNDQLAQEIIVDEDKTPSPEDDKSWFSSIFGNYGKRAKKVLDNQEKND